MWLLLLLDSLLLLLTARKTTFCIWGEQWSWVELRLDLLGLVLLDDDDDLEGEADLFLCGVTNLNGDDLCLGLMSRTWVSSSLHLTLLGLCCGCCCSCCCCCLSSSTTLAMMLLTVLVMGILTQETGLWPALCICGESNMVKLFRLTGDISRNNWRLISLMGDVSSDVTKERLNVNTGDQSYKCCYLSRAKWPPEGFLVSHWTHVMVLLSDWLLSEAVPSIVTHSRVTLPRTLGSLNLHS